MNTMKLCKIITCINLVLIIFFFCSCNEFSKKNTSDNQNLKKKGIYDLLNDTNTVAANLVLGKLDNLDIINGYHGLKLGVEFESLEFSFPSFNINTRHQASGIIKVHIPEEQYVSFMNSNCEVNLTFYKNVLFEISLLKRIKYVVNPFNSNKTFIDDFFFVPQSTNYYSSDYAALVKMFGEPNLKCKIGEIEPINIEFSTTHFQDIKCSWEGKNVLLIFSGRRFYNPRTLVSNNRIQHIVDEYNDGTSTQYEVIFQKRNLVYSYNLTIKNIEDSIDNSNSIIEKAKEKAEKEKTEEEFIKGF